MTDSTWYDEGLPCPRCGNVHERCKAHRNSDGMPCRSYPANNTRVCRFHGGTTAAAITKANERQTLQRVTAFLASHDIPLTRENPIDALLDEVARSGNAVRLLGMLVSELDIPDPHAEGGPFADLAGVNADGEVIMATPWAKLFGPDHQGDGAPHVVLAMWNAERDRHAKFAKMALDAGATERMVSLAESQGARMVTIIMGLIDAPTLNLTTDQRTTARLEAARLLRESSAIDVQGVPAVGTRKR